MGNTRFIPPPFLSGACLVLRKGPELLSESSQRVIALRIQAEKDDPGSWW